MTSEAIGEDDGVSDWQVALLERCADAHGAAVGDGAFAPGPALWVGTREVAHFDEERVLDVRLTKAVIRRRRDELRSDARISLRRGTSDWLAATIRSDGDVEWAAALIGDAVAANRATTTP